MENLIKPPTDDAWKQIVPILNETIAELGEIDRNAILCAFFARAIKTAWTTSSAR